MTAIFNILGSIFGYILWAIFYVVDNFGISIIIFTLFSKIILFPSSIKQQKSMAANSRLQKKQQEIREKYGNDKNKYNEEIQKLYEKENVSPFSGCLTSLFPMFVMLGIFYSVSRPLTNTLHIASEKINALLSFVNQIPGVSLLSKSIYSEIDVVRLFSDNEIFNMIRNNSTVTGLLSGNDIEKIKELSGGFKFLGLDLLSTPKNYGFSWLLIIPVLCLVTSIGSQIFMMRMNGNPMQNQQGCMKYMMLFLPVFSAWLAYTVPAAVGFYWICSTVFGFIQSIIMSRFYSPAMLTAKAEAQHVALLEIEEAKVKYDYQPTVINPNNKKSKKK